MLDKNNRDHKILLNKILGGEIVLFTGAGFSVGATNIRNEPVPSVKDLQRVLIKEILNITEENDREQFNEYFELNLKDLCDECEELNKSEFDKVLYKLFKVKSFDTHHKLYGEVDWKRVYTLNIDDLTEEIWENHNVDYVTFDDERPKSVRASEKTLYKLRGSVRNS